MSSQYWLMKSDSYFIDALKRDGQTCWEGVRNYQARNFMRDQMKVGDLTLFYHSNADPSGVAGIAKICKKSYPDFTAWDAKDKHFDPKASSENPIWMMVDVAYVEKFCHFVSLHELKANPALDGMLVLKRGMRLSIQPVEARHFEVVKKMGR